MVSPMADTTDIEATVNRVDRGLGLLISKRRSSPVTNALEISIRREGERLCRRPGHDALLDAAMLVVVRNPNSSRYTRAALLQGLWAPILAVHVITTTVPCPDTVNGEANGVSLMRTKKTKKTKTRKIAKKTKRASARAKPVVKRSD
jgi:hypothetical protein